MWKIVCAILGFILAGFIGALIGFFVGSMIDNAQKKGRFGQGYAKRRLQQETFFRTLFLLMGRLAKADGQVTKAEIELAQAVMLRLRLSPAAQEQAKKLFNEGKSDNFDLSQALNTFKLVAGTSELTRTLLEVLLVSAYADGHFSTAEKNFVFSVCEQLGVSQAEFDALHIQVKQQAHFSQGHQGADKRTSKDLLKAAYEALGVTPEMTDAEVKKAYRRLMSQHHPDKLSAKGLPDEMIEHAKQRTQEIQADYETVKKSSK